MHTKHTSNLQSNINISFLQLGTVSLAAAYPIIIKHEIIKLYIPEHINSLLLYFSIALLNKIHKIANIIIHLKLFPSK